MDHALDEVTHVRNDDAALPWFEADRAIVLMADPVLGEQAHPMFPVAPDFQAPDPGNGADPALRNLGHGPLSPSHDLWVLGVQADPQLPDIASTGREHPIAQVEPEEIRIGWAKLALIDACRHVSRHGAASDARARGLWCGGWDSNPQALTGSRV